MLGGSPTAQGAIFQVKPFLAAFIKAMGFLKSAMKAARMVCDPRIENVLKRRAA